MNKRLTELAAATSLAMSLVLTCSSCAQLKREEPAVAEASPEPAVRRVAQFSFGRDASFGVCAEPACPHVTPKTLASAAPAPQAASLPEVRPAPVVVPVRLVEPASPAASQPAPSKVSQATDRTRHLVVGFAFGSAELSAAARVALDASLNDARQSDRIVISGRTDAVGDVKPNQALAMARAMAVRDHLRTLAPDLGATISIDAQGRCCFVASNADEGGRARNRRVEIVFMAAGGA